MVGRAECPTDDAVERVSDHICLVRGHPTLDPALLPADPVMLRFELDLEWRSACLRVVSGSSWSFEAVGSGLTLVVARSTLLLLGIDAAPYPDESVFHMPSELRALLVAIRECEMHGEARVMFRHAKATELLCRTALLCERGALVPMGPNGGLSLGDVKRLFAAKRMIEECPSEKLTLDRIGRACGLNRAKLTRGYRELFDCTIAEALLEHRLTHARMLLLTTDLSISAVGYQSGYHSNASFTRAFGRKFGRPPSNIRAQPMAA